MLLPLLPVSRHGFGGGQTPIDEFLERTKSWPGKRWGHAAEVQTVSKMWNAPKHVANQTIAATIQPFVAWSAQIWHMAWHGYLPRYALDLLIFDSCTLAHWLVFKWKISFPNLPFHVWFESEPGSLAMICFHFRSIRRTQTQKFSQKFSHSTPQLSPCSSPSARLMSQMNLYVSRCERFFPTEPGYQVPGTGVPFKEADSRNHGNHVQVTKCPLADHPIRESVVETNPIERDRDVLWSSEGLRLEAFNFSNFSMDFPVVLEICTGILDETPTTAYAVSLCFWNLFSSSKNTDSSLSSSWTS